MEYEQKRRMHGCICLAIIFLLVAWVLVSGCVVTTENDGKFVFSIGTTITLGQEHPGDDKTSKTTITLLDEAWDWLKMKHLEKANENADAVGDPVTPE